MKKRLYNFKYYTNEGDLKSPSLLFYIQLFLARTWIILVISVVSRESGSQLLALFYPDKLHFYLGLIIGAIPLLIFFISGRRFKQKQWAIRCWPYCFVLLLSALIADLTMQLYYLNLVHFKYSLAASLQVVAILWSLLFVINSKQLRDSFQINKLKKSPTIK